VSRIGENKSNSKISTDSTFQSNPKKISAKEDNSKRKHIKKFDFVNEKEHKSRISMPLKKTLMVTSPFGLRVHPIFGTRKIHNGADL
ncbi:hypothetical protein ABTC40_20690, partial [Acinetobacter baumannii]